MSSVNSTEYDQGWEAYLTGEKDCPYASQGGGKSAERTEWWKGWLDSRAAADEKRRAHESTVIA